MHSQYGNVKQKGGIQMSLQIITNYADAITSACGLDENQAKTVVYWATATHAIDKLKKMPILVIQGGYGSGKSTLIELLKQICRSPMFIDGKVSRAEFRDSLKPFTTALIEEADDISEDWILKRYDKNISSTSVKRGGASQGWTREQLNLFGATVLHRRVPFKDPAIDSRSITIRTVHKPGNYIMAILDQSPLSIMASQVDWFKPLALPSCRAGDTWMPLFQVAAHCVDGDWIKYAAVELAKAIASVNEGQGDEPNQIVVRKLVSLAIDSFTLQLKQRVPLKDITKGLKDDGRNLNSWQVGKILRDLGFEVRLSGGTQYIQIHKANLLDVAKQLGIDYDLLKQMTP
jgi:ABC-type cobalamin/Fe3+-siderophores transport system ATPase subunit